MANRRKPTDGKRKAKFLEVLRETCNVSEAARQACASRKSFYEHREKVGDFRAAWEEALEVAADALEAEARRRAMVGVGEPVFYQGKKVSTVQRYSDTLLIFLLKGRRPDVFKERSEVELKGSVDLVGVMTKARKRVEEKRGSRG